MNKIKVLWFSNTPAAGDEYISSSGTGGWLKSLDKAIQDKIDLHVVFHGQGYPAEFKVGKTLYYCVSPRSKKERIYNKIRTLFGKQPETERNLAIVRKVNPDIVHVHGTEMSWIRVVKHIQNIPVVFSVQAIVTVMTHKYYSGLLKKDVPHFSIYNKNYGYYNQRAAEERYYIQYVPNLLGRTDWDRRVYSVLAPHARYFVCNEVLRDGFYHTIWKEPNRDDNKLIVHTTTGTHLFKGLETVCQAVNLLNHIGINVEWRVAGVNEDSEFVKIIKRKLKNDYPDKGLLLLGSLSEEKLIERLLEAHIYVSPSHQDNSPNALCEATMIGMPCISTCAGGSSTIIKDGVSGILIQDGDPWVMAGAVLELWRDRKMAVCYSAAARREALMRHDKQTIVDELLKVYQELMVK